jgi:hypothetical protein
MKNLISLRRLKIGFSVLGICLTAMFRTPPDAGKTVLFDLHDIDTIPNNSFGRLTYLLVMLFHENGYTICIRPNMRFITSFSALKYKNMILQFEPVFTWKKSHSAKYLCISDRVRTEHSTSVLLDYSEKPTPSEFRESIPMPFVMHPKIYRLGLHKGLQTLRETPTAIRLFFGGNLNTRQYDSEKMTSKYGKLSRMKVIQALRTHLHDRHKREIHNQKDLLDILESKHGGFSWIADPGLRIEISQWLKLLAQCDFFLACPGVSKPMCHNCVEAMSVGVIPVLEYPEFFHPPLVHGINCLIYDGEEDLLNKVNKVFSLDIPTINRLKQGAIDYYEAHLSPESFGDTIASLTGGDTITFLASKIAESTDTGAAISSPGINDGSL